MEKLLSRESLDTAGTIGGRQKNRRKIKAFLSIADHSMAGNLARGTGMTIDFKRLLKKYRKRIAGELNFTPTSAKTTFAGGLGSPAPDDKSKELNGTAEDASLQRTQWDRFFANLLNPQAMPELDRSTSAAAGSKAQDVKERSSAEAEAMMHLFTGSVVVQTLKAHLDKLPEIRQQQVDSLKQSLAEGRYQMHPQQIAAAMFADGGLDLG
jgi:flagellar biosynthesis anti-sigma factor FlgM